MACCDIALPGGDGGVEAKSDWIWGLDQEVRGPLLFRDPQKDSRLGVDSWDSLGNPRQSGTPKCRGFLGKQLPGLERTSLRLKFLSARLGIYFFEINYPALIFLN